MRYFWNGPPPPPPPPEPEPELTQPRLRREIARLAAVIGAPERDWVAFAPLDGAMPYIGEDPSGIFHWGVVERGQILEHRRTAELDEILYWSFEHTTSEMASRWRMRHRPAEAGDTRVVKWAVQFELLHRLDPRWAARLRQDLIRRCEAGDCMPDGGMPPLPGGR